MGGSPTPAGITAPGGVARLFKRWFAGDSPVQIENSSSGAIDFDKSFKLEKVSDNLLRELTKDRTPIDWEKKLCPLYFTLTNIRVELNLDIKRPETEFRIGDPDDEEDSAENTSYSESFGWRLTAIGEIRDGKRISLIMNDGTVTARSESFDRLDVVLTSIAYWNEKLAPGGLLFDCDHLTLMMPQERLDRLCSELSANRIATVELTAWIELFSSLFSPRLCFEVDNDGERAYLSRVSGYRSIGP